MLTAFESNFIVLSSLINLVTSFSIKGGPMVQHESVTLLQDDKTLAVVERNYLNQMTNCVLYDLEKQVDAVEICEQKYSKSVVFCDFKSMMSIINACERLPITKFHRQARKVSDIEVTFNSTDIRSLWRGIIPGTKWCGLGDEAKDYNDLGDQAEVDKCCRAHDHCPIRMKALRLDYGIINFSLYTRSHCRCDEAFYDCLREKRSPLGDLVGNFYFNIMQTSCIEEAAPCSSLLDPYCSSSSSFSVSSLSELQNEVKGRSSSTQRVIFVPNRLRY